MTDYSGDGLSESLAEHPVAPKGLVCVDPAVEMGGRKACGPSHGAAHMGLVCISRFDGYFRERAFGVLVENAVQIVE